MKEEPTNGELKIALDNIIDKLSDLAVSNDEGHKGIMDRQDLTNGNVLKNTKFRWATSAIIGFVTIVGIGNVIAIFII